MSSNALIAGVVSLIISVIASFIVGLIIPITAANAGTWVLIAVAVSAFFSGLASYAAAVRGPSVT